MRGLQLPLGVQLIDHASFDNFYAGPNFEALSAVSSLLASPGPQLLLLFGGSGSGKTHLLQSLSRSAAGSRACAYVPLRQLGVDALEGVDASELACLDDIDAVLGQQPSSLALLSFMDQLRAHGGRCALSAAAPPERLAVALPDLKTRLSAAAVFGLRPLDDADRRGLLRSRARARGLELPEDAAEALLRQLPRDIGSLLAAIEALDHAALSAQRRLTLPFVQQWLRESGAKRA